MIKQKFDPSRTCYGRGEVHLISPLHFANFVLNTLKNLTVKSCGKLYNVNSDLK